MVDARGMMAPVARRRGRWTRLSAALVATSCAGGPIAMADAIAKAPAACLASTCEPAQQADLFADSIGFDVPIYWEKSFPSLAPLLSRAGVRHVRVGMCQDQVQCAFYQTLLKAGIHGTVILGVNSSASQVAQALAPNGDLAEGAFIEAMEGINEPNNAGLPGYTTNWVAKTRAAQQMLWNTVKSSARGAQVKVLGPSVCCNSTDQAALGDLTASLDYGNQHVYFGQQNPGALFYTGAAITDFNRQLQTSISGTKPVQTTETGWGSRTSDPASGVDPVVQQKYIIRSFLESFAHGIPRTFDYVFADDPSAGAAYGSYGVVSVAANASLTPKPAYVAVANLLSVLADPGPAFQPTGLSYALSGDAASVDHLLLQRRDGSFDLVLWAEVPGWDPVKQAARHYVPQVVTIKTSTPLASATMFSFDPLGSGALGRIPLALVGDAVTVVVSDQATIVHLVPRGTTTTQSVPAADPGFATVRNANSGMCFYVVNASLSAGTAIAQNTCSTGRNEQFSVARQANGSYRLRDDNSRNCIAEVGTGIGSPVRTVAGCTATDPSQEFTLRPVSASTYLLVDRESNLCIDVPGQSTVVGAQMQMQTCTGSRSQTWTIRYTE